MNAATKETPLLGIWRVMTDGTGKDPRSLGWLAACHLLHAERVNIRFTTQHPLVGLSSTVESWQASKTAAIEYAERALGRLNHLDAKDQGRHFCRSVADRARALTQSRVPAREITNTVTARFLVDHGMHVVEDRAIAAGGQTLDSLSELVRELRGSQWLAGHGGLSQ